MTQEITCVGLFWKTETLTHVFSFKSCQSFKNTYFKEHLQATASANIYGGAFLEKYLIDKRNHQKYLTGS